MGKGAKGVVARRLWGRGSRIGGKRGVGGFLAGVVEVGKRGWTVELEQSQQVALAVPVSERDHARGAGEGAVAVTVVEYGDYECPYCERAYPIVKRMLAEMPGGVRFVFRNFPQNSIHAHASVAAQAAEAAGAQGKFWEMHDMLYEHQDQLGEVDIVHFGLRVGVEVYKFQADLLGEVYAKRVKEDFDGGVRSGVRGTPTFFINGKRYEGALEYEALAGAVRGAETKKG